MLIAEIEVTSARDLYKAEYRHARMSFGGNWQYSGRECAFARLWQTYTAFKMNSRLLENASARREFHILACAHYSLYNELIERHQDLHPDLGIPF